MAEVGTDQVMAALHDVVDPCCRERELSVLDMGLLEGIEVDRGHVRVDLVLTSGWCPFQVDLLDTVTRAVDALPGVAGTDVRITLDRPWDTGRMSERARRALTFLPRPDEVDRDAWVADATAPGPNGLLPVATPDHTPDPAAGSGRPNGVHDDR